MSENVHLRAMMYIWEQNVHFVANLACFWKLEVFIKMSKNVKKCQNDIAKVGEEERRRKKERNRVHRGSFQNPKIRMCCHRGSSRT